MKPKHCEESEENDESSSSMDDKDNKCENKRAQSYHKMEDVVLGKRPRRESTKHAKGIVHQASL